MSPTSRDWRTTSLALVSRDDFQQVHNRQDYFDLNLRTGGKELSMEGPLSFFLFFFVVVPFVLINMTNYIKERRQADENVQTLLKENNDLLREFIAKIK